MGRRMPSVLLPLVCASASLLTWWSTQPRTHGAGSIALATADPGADAPDPGAPAARGPLARLATPVVAHSERAASRRALPSSSTPPRGPRWTTSAERVAVGAAELARAIDWPASEAEVAQLAQWVAARPDVDAALAEREDGATWRFNRAATAWHQDLITLVGLSRAARVAATVELVLIDGESREPVRVGVEGRFLTVPLRVARD